MPLPAGTRLSHYEIRSPLGSGGMGEVYRARDLTLDRDVALKLLPAAYANDRDRLRRFEQEARSASALNHPAIVSIYEFGQTDGQPFISMELVNGQTLRQILAGPSLPPKRVLQIAAQVADALAKAHAAGLVHRDLKPENVMVTNDGYAKILDFGLAKLIDASDVISAQPTVTNLDTLPGTILGTVGYMSPEQASGQPVDHRSDQFAFGVVFYEMLTGRRAFARPTAAETLSAIIREDPPPMDSRTGALPAPVRWIAERCLAKAPDERYAATQDLARELAIARDRFAEIAATSTPPLPRARVGRREAAAWILTGLVGLTAVAFAVWGREAQAPTRSARFTLAPPPDSTFALSVGVSPFAVSPDGQQIAIAAVTNNRRQLWLRRMDALEPRLLPGTEGAATPFWSPDNRAVAFYADGHLKRVSIPEGEVSTLCDSRNGLGGTWNREGVIVFSPGVDSALYRVSADGGTPTPVTVLDKAHEESLHATPVFLPDGRHFFFFVLGKDNAGTYVGSLDAPDRKRVAGLADGIAVVGLRSPDYVFSMREDRAMVAQRLDLDRLELAGDPIVVAENTAFSGPTPAVAVSPNGTIVHWTGDRNISQLTWLRRDGTTDGVIGPPGWYMNIALSPDGQQVAVDRFDVAPAIWLIDVTRGTLTRTTFEEAYVSTPVWSPDGRVLTYAASSDTPPNLFLKPADRVGDPKRLFRTILQSFPQSWSGDRIVYLTIDPKTASDIWSVNASGSVEPTPLINTPFFEGYARISPDGRWLAYVSNNSGRRNVFITTFPTPGRELSVSPDGGGFPVWRRDSRELFYRDLTGQFMAVPIDSTTTLKPGKPLPLFKANAVPGLLGSGTFYDVAADGRFLINMHVERRTAPATVIMNWTPPR